MASLFGVPLIGSVPVAEMVFVYIARSMADRLVDDAMLWAVASRQFLLGGVTGIFLGAAGADIYFRRVARDRPLPPVHPIAFIAGFAGITLVPEDVRPHVGRAARQDSLLGHDHRVQRDSSRSSSRARPGIIAASTTTRSSWT
jgi:hypothetical protein